MPLALGPEISEVTLARNPFNTGDNRLWASGLEAGGGDPAAWPTQHTVTVPLDEVGTGE
jgi:hypothetical protein